MNCRHCGQALTLPLIDLGSAPPSNAYLQAVDLSAPERWYPLRVMVCQHCWLVQTEDFARADMLFDADYAYFSSYSSSWLAHAQRYVAQMQARFALDHNSMVVEIAANDGYLLQYVRDAGMACYGVEPTASTARAARDRGLTIVEAFFGTELASSLAAAGRQADLMVANNVLAHVPDINDFVAGFARLLKPQGVATFEFPHLLSLLQGCQFDTIYHEHFSYLSLTALQAVFAAAGLQVFDVERLPTHGGSLRVYVQPVASGCQPLAGRVAELLADEQAAGLLQQAGYADFQQRADRVKNDFLQFLLQAHREGKRVMAYGAAAKGNTLLNYAGVRPDLLPAVADRNPAKQGRYLPGSRIPVVAEAVLQQQQPDYVVLLPWNLRDELMAQLDYIRAWGGRFVVAVPALTVLD